MCMPMCTHACACVHVCAYACVLCTCTGYLLRSEEGVRSSEAGVTGGCGLLMWERKSGPLQEQVLSALEPSFDVLRLIHKASKL